ncbi:hypothetical protein V6O07_22835 [Arthrospira platensis SPKY2]
MGGGTSHTDDDKQKKKRYNTLDSTYKEKKMKQISMTLSNYQYDKKKRFKTKYKLNKYNNIFQILEYQLDLKKRRERKAFKQRKDLILQDLYLNKITLVEAIIRIKAGTDLTQKQIKDMIESSNLFSAKSR